MDDLLRRRPGSRRTLPARVGSLALAAGLLAGCGSGGSGTGGPAASPGPAVATQPSAPATQPSAPATQTAAEQVVITIQDFAFQVPATVPAGAEITVRNLDGVGHTVTADEGAFDVAVPPGQAVTFTAPSGAGKYPFHCTPHPAMTATLDVEGDG